ncbi:MAG: 6-phosphogluconolactonase [Candidatus Limnocylindrales bacterium]
MSEAGRASSSETDAGPSSPGAIAGEPAIHILPDPPATSRAAAAIIADALTSAVRERGVAHWSTTGGSTPVGIYRVLADQPFRDEVPWDGVHIWWGDDRFVPRDDPLSNVLACVEILLGGAGRGGLSGTGASGFALDGSTPGVPVPFDQVHAMPIAEAIGRGHPAAWAAARYEAQLRAAALPLDDAGYPILDIVLVGVGSDGHLFSVFPGSATWHDAAWAQAVPAPTHIAPRVARVTLHPRILDAARMPIAVLHGANKAATVASVFGSRADLRELPAGLVRRPGAIWTLDEAAAAGLPPDIRAGAIVGG